MACPAGPNLVYHGNQSGWSLEPVGDLPEVRTLNDFLLAQHSIHWLH